MTNSTNTDDTKRRHWLIPVLATILILVVVLATLYSAWCTRSGFQRGQEVMDAILAAGPAGVAKAHGGDAHWYVQQRPITAGSRAISTVLGYRAVYITPPADDGSVTLIEIVINTTNIKPDQPTLANSWERVTLHADGSGTADFAFFEIPLAFRFTPQELTTDDWTVTPITTVQFDAEQVTYTPYGNDTATETIATPQAYLPMGLWPIATYRVAIGDNDALFNSLIPQPNRASRFFTRLEELTVSPLNAKQVAHIEGAHAGVYLAQANTRGAPTMIAFDEHGRVLERHFEHMTEIRTAPPADDYVAAVLTLVANELFPTETPAPEDTPAEE